MTNRGCQLWPEEMHYLVYETCLIWELPVFSLIFLLVVAWGVGHRQGSCLLKTSFLSLGCFTTCSFRARPMKIFEFMSWGLKGQKQTLPLFLEYVEKWKFHHHFPLGYFVTLPTFQKYCLLSILIHFLLPYPVPSISRTPAQKSVGFQEYSY